MKEGRSREQEKLRPVMPRGKKLVFFALDLSLVFPLLVRTGSGMSPHQRENPKNQQVSVRNRLSRTVEYIT